MNKVKDCQKIILQCNDIRPGEAENIISQARTISSMTKRCDERKPVDKEVKGQKAKRTKRSATSEEGQKDNGRDWKGSLKMRSKINGFNGFSIFNAE